MHRAKLRARAEVILRTNDRGGYTVPAARLYPHQWNWDSAFAAIGWSHVEPRRAASELAMLARGQWDDGMIAHIVFNPEAEHYEPGPRTWRTEGAAGSPRGVRTSSITQPPVAATAALALLRRAGGDAEVERVLRDLVPALERSHAWLLDARDPRGLGLPCVVHPWESGMDNSPRWDEAMRRIDPGLVEYKRMDDTIIDPAQRPTRYDYDRYFFLVQERARRGFTRPVRADEPFLVADVALASILCRADEDLAALAEALGAEAPGARTRRERVAGGLATALRDPGRGRSLDLDVVSGRLIDVDHAASLLPLFAGVVAPDEAARLAALLEDPATFGTPFPVPSVARSHPAFDSRRYWRGPAWVNVNWMIVDGLARAGQRSAAGRLAERTIEMVARSGFFEYFDPLTGDGLGADEFTWTAALVIDLMAAWPA
jgi:glycogen debranching enzyme